MRRVYVKKLTSIDYFSAYFVIVPDPYQWIEIMTSCKASSKIIAEYIIFSSTVKSLYNTSSWGTYATDSCEDEIVTSKD